MEQQHPSKVDEAPSRTGLSPKERRKGLVYVLGFAALLVSGRLYEQTPLDGVIWCVFRRATGLDCPGCGITRSLVSMMHGDVAASLSAHPFGLLFFATLGIVAIHRGLESALNRKVGWPGEALWARVGNRVLGAILLIVVAFGIWRNLG
ncbi:MAG: DUF2752 domain-containing protein [Bradymonadaceae bacterium]